MKFSRSLRQRLSQSPVGKLRERLSRSPTSAPAAIAEDVEVGGNGKTGKAMLATEEVMEKEVKFSESGLKRSLPWLKKPGSTSSPDSSGKKRRLKDRLPTPKLALKPNEKLKSRRHVRGADQVASLKRGSFKSESAASFPEVLKIASLPRNYSVSDAEADDVQLKTSSSMKEVRGASNVGANMRTSNSLNDVRSSFQPPLKPPRTFQKRPPWKN